MRENTSMVGVWLLVIVNDSSQFNICVEMILGYMQ